MNDRPTTFLQKIIARTYAITLGCIIAALSVMNIVAFHPWLQRQVGKTPGALGLGIKLSRSIRRSVSGLAPYMVLSTCAGWAWCLWAVSQGAWKFHWWTVTGISFLGMSLEDWVICPLCSYLFWIIFTIIPKKTNAKLRIRIPFVGCCLSIAGMYVFAPCGLSLTGLFVIPGLMLCVLYGVEERHFVWCTVLVMLFAGIWDLWATTIGPMLWPWYEQWVYPTGKFYLPVRVGNSPIEITPLFGLAGAWFCYGLWRCLTEERK